MDFNIPNQINLHVLLRNFNVVKQVTRGLHYQLNNQLTPQVFYASAPTQMMQRSKRSAGRRASTAARERKCGLMCFPPTEMSAAAIRSNIKLVS